MGWIWNIIALEMLGSSKVGKGGCWNCDLRVIDEEDVESLISEVVIAVNGSQVFHVLLLASSV